MQVKIVFASTNYYGDDDVNWDEVRSSITDWEEISNEDLALLKAWLPTLIPASVFPPGFEPKILIKDPKPISDRLLSIRELIDARKEKEEADKRRREEAKIKKQLAKNAKTEIAEKELYEHLKSKFEKGA